MKIVRKFIKNEAIKLLREISADEENALYSVFVKNNGNSFQKKLACSIAEFMKDNDGWLQCHCNHDNPPLMTIGLSIKRNYYLQRINSRGSHQKNCRFKGLDYPTQSNSSSIKPLNKNSPLNLHQRGNIGSESKSNNSTNPSARTGEKSSKLSRFLYNLINDTALNKLTINEPEGLVNSFKKMKQAAANYQLMKGIDASRYLWTYPNIEQISAYLKKTTNMWPKNGRPHALCISIADSTEDNNLIFSFKESPVKIKLAGTLKSSSGRLGQKSSPFLVIFTIADTEENRGEYVAYNGFFVPVYSKRQLIPVDSIYERKVLEMIEQRARWWIKDKGLSAEIYKPLFDIQEFHDGELKASRPDFLIKTPKGNIIFEVMGSHEETYLERKKRTTAYMRSIGEVIEFDALEADKSGQWDERLKNKISQLSALVFQGNNQ